MDTYFFEKSRPFPLMARAGSTMNTKAAPTRQPRAPPPPPPPPPALVDDDDNVLALSCTHSISSSENDDSPKRGRALIQAVLQEQKSNDDDSCISIKEEARRYLIRYEAMVHQQEATQAATLAHLLPAWQRLFPNRQEVSRAEWQRAHQQLQAAAADMSPDQFVTTDRPFMMLVRLLSEESSSTAATTTTIWDFLQAYQITCHGMMLLEALDLSDSTKTSRTTHRSLVRHRTLAMAALALGLNSRKKSRTSRRCRLMLYALCFWLSSLVIGVTVVATVAYLFSSTEETVVSPTESATSTAAVATMVENITTSPRLLPFLAEPVVVVAQKENIDLVPVDKSVATPVATTVLPTPSTPVVAVAPQSDRRTESPLSTTSTTRKTLALSTTTTTTHLPHWFQSLASSPDHDPPRLEVAAAVPTTLIVALLVTPSWPMIVASSLVVAVASAAVNHMPARAAATV
jgi:hypothetical protein